MSEIGGIDSVEFLGSNMIFLLNGRRVIPVSALVAESCADSGEHWPESLNGDYQWENPEVQRWAPAATTDIDRIFE